MAARSTHQQSTTPLSPLDQHLAYLKLSFIAEQYTALATQAADKAWSHVDYLARLMEGEADVRGDRAGVMKKRVIPPPGIDPVFVPLAYEVPRPFSSSLVQRVQGFFCTKRAPVWWKRLPELFVSPLLWWWRPSQQHSRSGQSTHSLPGPVPSV